MPFPSVADRRRVPEVDVPRRLAANGSPRIWHWTAVAVVSGIILIVGATLSVLSVAVTAPVPGIAALEKAPIAVGVDKGIEFVLGCWLLIGSRGLATWSVSLGTFAIFACVAAYRAAGGAESCGCFGPVHVNPWYTASFDVSAAVVLLACYRAAKTQQPRRLPTWRWATFVAVCLMAVGPGTWFMTRHARGKPGDDGLPVANGVTILEPQTWIGRPFPLDRYIDIGGELANGRCVVVLYRSDCDHCRRAIPRYEAVAASWKDRAGVPMVALIEMSPYAPPGRGLIGANSRAMVGKLSDSREWFAQTPVAILLEDGKVVRAVEGEDAESPDHLLASASLRR